MALNLFKISDDVFAMSDLKSDHLFEKIPKNRIKYYVDSALGIGRVAADTVKLKSQDLSLRKICEERNIKINIIDKEYKIGKIKFRAEILLKKRHINIMKESIIQLKDGLPENFSFNDIVDIHIAHEFYHFIEFDKNVKTNQLLDRIESFKLGPFKRFSTVVKTSEIAAHSFCKRLIELDFHPKALDYLYMLKNNMITEEKLSEYFDHLKGFYYYE